jgi:hypothetical protein
MVAARHWHDGNHGIVMNALIRYGERRRSLPHAALQHAVPRPRCGRAPAWKARTFKSNRPLHKHIPGQAEESKPKAASEKVPPCSKLNPQSRPAGARQLVGSPHLGF